ncbi:hypothetical protein MKW92_007898 [Papaver armeniacum]|nr:hypothetical protein MKW92_007898 [Papaver armeniacum]
MMMIMIMMMMILMMPTPVLSKGWTVGDNHGWSANVNYTNWSEDISFVKDDWLVFVFDRNQQIVLEVNQTNYDACNGKDPIKRWSAGDGSAVVHLNEVRKYFFISKEESCFFGVKLDVVVKPAKPATNGAARSVFMPLLVLLIALPCELR